MQEPLEELIRAYKANYPQEVRDLAETFCNSTTRLGHARQSGPRELTEEVRRRAAAHGISDVDLAAAVAHYARIESLAEASHRLKG